MVSRRKPFHYPVGEQGRVLSDPDLNAAATYSRYRYYNKLVHPATQLLVRLPLSYTLRDVSRDLERR